MSTSRLLLSSMLVSSALIMGACGNKDKGASEKITSAAMDTLSADKIDNKTFETLLDVTSRTTPEAEANKALAKMGFDKSGSGALSWDAKSGQDGNYTYSNLTAKGGDGEDIKISELSLTGVHMDGDEPTFDRVDMKGLSLVNDDDTVSVASLSMANPSPKIGAALVTFVEGIDNLDDLDMDIDLDDGEIPFGALLMSGLNVKSDDANVNLASIGWSEDAGTHKGLFLLEGLSVDGETEDSKSPVKISLGSVSAAGLDMNALRGMDGKSGSGLNPLSKIYDSFSIDKLAVNADTLSLTSDGIVGKAVQKGDVTTIKQSVKPFTLSFSGEPEDRKIAQLQQTLASAGFEKIVFSAGSTTKLDAKADSFDVTDSFLTVDDAFDMNFAYGGTGLSAITKAMDEAGGEGMNGKNADEILDGVSLGHFDLSLTDNSILEKIFAVVASQQGSTPAMIKMQAKSGLMMLGMAAQTESQGKALTDLSSALGKLLDEGGTLKISLRPENPVVLSSLKDANPQTLDPEMLGFSVEHKK